MKYHAILKLNGKGDRKLLGMAKDDEDGRGWVGQEMSVLGDRNVIAVALEELEDLYDWLYAYDLDPVEKTAIRPEDSDRPEGRRPS